MPPLNCLAFLQNGDLDLHPPQSGEPASLPSCSMYEWEQAESRLLSVPHLHRLHKHGTFCVSGCIIGVPAIGSWPKRMPCEDVLQMRIGKILKRRCRSPRPLSSIVPRKCVSLLSISVPINHRGNSHTTNWLSLSPHLEIFADGKKLW